ncbi:transthyretin-like family protein [Ferruginibacter sp.]
MKYTIIISLFLVALLAACKKESDFGNGYVHGKVYLADKYTSTGNNEPLANATVRIQYTDKDTVNGYLYSVKTDNDGYFIFENTVKDKEYLIFSETEKTNTTNPKIIFYNSKAVKSATDQISLVLTADNKKQNALFITTADQFGGKLQNVNVFVYSSRVLATADSGAVSGIGSAFQFQSDTYGRIFKTNITDSVFINAKGVYGNVTLKRALYFGLPATTGVSTIPLTLK